MNEREHNLDRQTDRIEYITAINVIAMLAVVIIHANGTGFWYNCAEHYWVFANVIECVCYFAVPVFFMITGVTLLDYNKKYPTKTYFIKRFKKAVIPFLFWSVFAVVWFYRSDLINVLTGKIDAFPNVSFDDLINGIINTKYMGVYWFFIPLFCVYLVIPIFASIPENKRKRVFSYIILVSFIINIFVPFLLSIFGELFCISIKWKFSFSVGLEYVFYVLVGYMIHNYEIKRKLRFVIYGCSVFGLLMHIVGTYLFTRMHGDISEVFKGYCNLPSTLYSIGVFIFLKEFTSKITNKKIIRFINHLNGYTFGIYLIHFYVLHQLVGYIFSLAGFREDSITFVILGTFFTVIISIAIIWLLRRIPIIRKVVPR